MTLLLDKGGWKPVAFGDVVRNINESVKDPAALGIHRVIAMEHLDSGGSRVHRWADLEVGTTFTRRVRPGQTLFGKRRAYQRKAAFAEFDAICSGDILVFEADADQLLPELLPFVVQSDGFYDHALGTSAGSLSPRTNWRDLSQYCFHLPPIEDQKRIAALLWAVERHRLSTVVVADAVSVVEDEWLDSVYNDASASHISVGSLLGEGLLKLLTGPFGSTLSAKEYTGEGVPVIHPSFIVGGRLTIDHGSFVSLETAERLDRWKVREGDIIFMRKRDVTRSAVVTKNEEGWILGSDCISIRVTDAPFLPAYVRAMLRAPTARRELLRRAPGTAMPGINERSLAELSLPSIRIEEQQAVLARLKSIERVREEVQRARKTQTELRSSLLAEALGGAS